MRRFVQSIRAFFASMGLVEQAQVVASTAVVVAMVTIVTSRIVAREALGTLDFISVLTVGVIGYVSVYFSLKYGRMLEEQRRELLELNTITEAVNRSVELNTVVESALDKVMQLMRADSGWIYLNEDQQLVLKQRGGTNVDCFPLACRVDDDSLAWIRTPGLFRLDDKEILYSTTVQFKEDGIKMLASIPLVRQNLFAGVLIIGSRDVRRFEAKKIAVIQAFGNQISAALNNAWLFEQVRDSEKRYADLYEHSPDMYHSVDRNGRVVSCNETESELLGLPKEDIIGKPVINLYPEFQQREVAMNLRKIFTQGLELRGMEEKIKGRNGSLIDVSVNTSLIRDADGRPIIARIVLRDITEKKKMEEKILQAQKIDSLGNIAGGIAHNFNNILTAILGSASIMRRRMKDDSRSVKYVDLIETTSRRGAAITRQLTTFARKSTPRVDRVDVNGIIDQTVRLFEVTAPKSIHIKCVLSPEPAIVEADEAQLQQAFLNLCLNARDAMPDGGVLVINCSVGSLEGDQAAQWTEGKPGCYVVVSVADSGTGIPPEVLKHIYEPFFTTKDQGKGTGLGLSVVHGVIRSHGGYINVSSEVNSGTVFTIHLPKVADSGAVPARRSDAKDLVGGTERILMIEDEISVGEVGGDILQELGYTIDFAQNGREAIELLSDDGRRYDLVILDMNMPRMGGRATCEGIKEKFPALKILVCSGYSTTMIDDGTFARSVDGFIQKPYELEDFAHRVREVLDTPPRVRAAAS